MPRWRPTIDTRAWRLRIREALLGDDSAASPYETTVERLVRRHPRVSLIVAEAALSAGSLGAWLAVVEHWSLTRDPAVALLTGAGAALTAAAALARLRRDGIAAPVLILVASWLPPVLAGVAALQPESAGGWVAVAGYGFLAVYLAACGALLAVAPRITRHEEQLRRALFRERRRATLSTLRRRPPRHPRVAPKPGGPRPSP